MIRYRYVKLSDDVVLNYINKSEDYLLKLKKKVLTENYSKYFKFEDGYLLHNKKEKIFYLFPNMMLYNEHLRQVNIDNGFAYMYGEKRNINALYRKIYNIVSFQNKVKIISSKPTDVLLHGIFKANGHIQQSVISSTIVRYRGYVYDIDISDHIFFDLRDTKEGAEKDIVEFYSKRLNSIVKCDYIVLSIKDRQFFLTEDGRVYNEHLRELTVDAEGFVVLSRLRRKVENLLKEFF